MVPWKGERPHGGLRRLPLLALRLVIALGPAGMAERCRGPLHERVSQDLGPRETPGAPGRLAAACGAGRAPGLGLPGGGGRIPGALCPTGAAETRSADGPGPGEGRAERASGLALGPLRAGGVASGARLPGGTELGTKGLPPEGLGRDAPLSRGQGEGGADGLETASADRWRAHMMGPGEACAGGATGEWPRLAGGPAIQDGAKEQGGFVWQPGQPVRTLVLERPGQALEQPAWGAPHAAAGCDAWGERPQRGTRRPGGGPLVALGQPPCVLACGLGRGRRGPGWGAGCARARQRQRREGEEDEAGSLAQGGDTGPGGQCEADRHGLAAEPRAPRGAPRGNGLGRVHARHALPFGGASSLETTRRGGISPVAPQKGRTGVVGWLCQTASPRGCERRATRDRRAAVRRRHEREPGARQPLRRRGRTPAPPRRRS